jgi:hypothetical protein
MVKDKKKARKKRRDPFKPPDTGKRFCIILHGGVEFYIAAGTLDDALIKVSEQILIKEIREVTFQ